MSENLKKDIRILLTNDDGIKSRGIILLAEHLAEIGRVTVVAPDKERSAISHALTFFNPIRVDHIGSDENIEYYECNGTPTDCVYLGVKSVMKTKPDIIVSGINKGGNLGYDVTYSGTVAAAMEGAIQGIPSMAVSNFSYKAHKFEAAAIFAAQIVPIIVQNGLPEGVFLNINVPSIPPKDIKGVMITFQGKSIYTSEVICRKDPWDRDYYWVSSERPQGREEPGSDFDAVSKNMISVSPLQLTLTKKDFMSQLQNWNLDKHLKREVSS